MRQRLRRLLPIGHVELTEIPRNALLKLCPAPLHLSACEVPIAVVHRFKFTAVNGWARAWSDRSPLAPPRNFKRQFWLEFNNYLRSNLTLRGLSSLYVKLGDDPHRIIQSMAALHLSVSADDRDQCQV